MLRFETGKCVGRADLTIEIEVFIFSGSVTISCERKFAGSNGDPTLRQLMGLSPTLDCHWQMNWPPLAPIRPMAGATIALRSPKVNWR